MLKIQKKKLFSTLLFEKIIKFFKKNKDGNGRILLKYSSQSQVNYLIFSRFMEGDTIISFINDYFILFVFIVVAFSLSLLLFIITIIINKGTTILDNEKLMTYECGFDPIKNSRQIIDISFYRIAVLYILFDLEIIILVPLLVSLNLFNFDDISHFYYFLLILMLSLFFELKSEMLKW